MEEMSLHVNIQGKETPIKVILKVYLGFLDFFNGR